MNLPNLKDFDLKGKRVLVRADLDLASDKEIDKDLRLTSLTKTLDLLKNQQNIITIIGHKGRPEGIKDESLSLMYLSDYFKKWDANLFENLRFNKGEEENNFEFAKKLAENQDFFVNEAFGVSHREHASIVTLPKLLPHAAGLRFCEEIENLSRVFSDQVKHPIVSVIGGFKDDKLKYIDNFLEFSDKILIGGRMPDYIHDSSPLRKNPKVNVASLIADKEDISLHSIESFEDEISKAGTIILSGPMGKYEEEGHRQGTHRIINAVANSLAFRIAGGGDTESAINLLGLKEKFDWVSVGGGAMLDFLAYKTLVGIKALLEP